ncbi:MAG: hypothetical protein IKZ16_08855 [Clostridia bacterium]|nr:hypothetical protein [Clostridia bacterium]MBR5881786.1 hypothetical protein [Clostridia bacterium]
MAMFSSRAREMNLREAELRRYKGARFNLVVALAFTLVNCIMAATGSSTYYLFSCSIPYVMIVQGLFSCGMLLTPEEYLEEYGMTELDFMPKEFLYILIGIAAAVILVYVAFFFLSKKHAGWMIAATVFFGLDTVFMLVWYGIDLSMIADYVLHAWVMFILIRGLIGYFRAKKIPEIEPEEAQA